MSGAARLPWLRDTQWWICFLSFTSLGLTQAGGLFTDAGATLAPALFLAIWLGRAAARPRQALGRILSWRLPYALPLLALVSMSWSANPSHTMRTALEFLIVVVVAVYAAASLAPGVMVSALMGATLLPVLFSLTSGMHQEIQYAGNEALSGLFGSKNYMGYMGALLGLMSFATLADRRQPWMLRLAGIAGFLLGAVVLLQARSMDAILAFSLGLAPLCYVTLLGKLARNARILVNGAAGVLAVLGAAIAFALKDQLFAMVLDATGKDAGLTGRGYLWDHARQFISLRPLRGLGYQAFWVEGNPEAEALWHHFDVHGGFSFHNMYYQISVDLGAIGAATWFGVFAIVLVATGVRALRRPDPAIGFFFAFMVFTAIRLFVETELYGPFDLGPILVAASWVYATGKVRQPALLAVRQGQAAAV
jgi:exopolysaccharide production protein ExoQ